MVAMSLMRFALGFTAAFASNTISAECASSCTAEPPAEAPGRRASLLQARKRMEGSLLLGESAMLKVLAGVNVTIHLGQEGNHLYVAEAPHAWAVALPEGCSNEDIERFGTDLPNGVQLLFKGTPSSSGLCMVGMEATEEQLGRHLASRPGAVHAELDLEAEEVRRRQRGVSLEQGASPVPPQEGLPSLSTAFAKKRRKRQPSNLSGVVHEDFAMEKALDIDVTEFGVGKSCGPPYMVNVYFPVSKAKKADQDIVSHQHPIVSVGHGYMQYGHFVDEQLSEGLIKPLVKRGYIVVAHQGGEKWCESSEDQLDALRWLVNHSAFRDEVDPTRAALVGFSMGGLGALEAAATRAAVDSHHIKAVVALMPPCQSGCATPTVPVLYGTGTQDEYCNDTLVRQAYRHVVEDPKILVDIQGAPHWEVGLWGHNRHMPHVARFLDCHVQDMAAECDVYAEWPSQSVPLRYKKEIERFEAKRAIARSDGV